MDEGSYDDMFQHAEDLAGLEKSVGGMVICTGDIDSFQSCT